MLSRQLSFLTLSQSDMGLHGGGRAEHKLWENDANSLQFAAQVGSSCTLTSNPIHKREPLLAFSNRLKPQLQSQGFQFVSPISIHFCMTPNWKTRSFMITVNPLPAHPYVRPDCMDRVAKDAKSNLQHKLRKARFKYFSFVLFACFCIKLEPMRQFQLNSWGFPRLGDPQNQPFFGIFHCKSSILEYPSFLAAGLPGSQCSKGTGLFRADLHAAPFIG